MTNFGLFFYGTMDKTLITYRNLLKSTDGGKTPIISQPQKPTQYVVSAKEPVLSFIAMYRPIYGEYTIKDNILDNMTARC
jgi:hypothetical protein